MTAKQAVQLEVVARRDVLIGSAAAALLLGLAASGARAQQASPTVATAATADKPASTLQEALTRIMGEAKPVEGSKAFSLDIPEIAENGNTVPFTLAVESPMTEAAHVKALHLIATGNPQLDVARFEFTLLSGKAAVSSRMRLAKTQDVIAVAELSSGQFLLGKRTVKVTIGGCGG